MTTDERFAMLVAQRAAQGLGPTMTETARLRRIFERLADAEPEAKAS